MAKVSMADILQLSPAERIQLVGDIWDSLAAMPESITLTDAQSEELDRRLDDYHQHPEEGIPWETLQAQLLGSKP